MVNSWKIILATMVIFGAGVVTGGLLVRHSQERSQAPAPPPHTAATSATTPRLSHAPVITASTARLDFLRRAERDLDLTREQREKIDGILRESQERTRRLTREEVQRTREEFRATLTPSQKKQFEELMRQQRAAEQKQRGTAPGASKPQTVVTNG